jgi:hypothetical protein
VGGEKMSDQKKESQDEVDDAEVYLTPPENTQEKILYNLRPKPVLPALVAFVFSMMFFNENPMVAAVILLAAYGLMVGAGFCSFFPQLFSIGFSFMLFDVAVKTNAPAYITYILYLGIAISLAMLFVQFKRVKSGKFVPLIDRSPKKDEFE